MQTMLTYFTTLETTAHEAVHAGDCVHLCPSDDARGTEARTACGRVLGRLPPAERTALGLAGVTTTLCARVAAVMPRPGLLRADRVILRVETVP